MLKGNKVYIRPIVKSDIEKLNSWKNNLQIFKFLGGGFRPVSIDQQEKWIEKIIDLTGNDRRFIISTNDDKSVGMVGLYDIDWISRSCEIGVYVGEQSMQGNGYASEACKLIERYAFDILNIRKIKLKVVSENFKALNMWKKLGYVQVGEYKDDRYIEGKYYNIILMEKFARGGGSFISK